MPNSETTGPVSPSGSGDQLNRHGYVCPIDHGRLIAAADHLVCSVCQTEFPVISGVPILINDANSVFRIADYNTPTSYGGASDYGGSMDKTSGFRRAYRVFAHRLAEAPIYGGDQFDPLPAIQAKAKNPRILVLGAGERRPEFNAVLTDVARSPHIDCVCDAHDIPFPDSSFDAVFASSILEHVCDPQRCVEEIRRVLTDDGYVFANTPFLQPVHMGAYDFTRFTRLGHRRLFRYFDEVTSGMSGGPAYTAIHLTRNLITNLSDQPKTRRYLKLAALLASFPLRYLDPLLSRTESANNAACGFYFLGRKRSSPIPDRDIIDLFRGA